MACPTGASSLDVVSRPGTPPVLVAGTAGEPSAWVAGHRGPLRAFVAEHGAIVVRGLGVRDVTGAAAVFREFAADLMVERETFAHRRRYAGGVHSSSPWPPNQPMCMHHELSYAFEFPGLMMFACLRPPVTGGATGVADSSRVLAALPPRLVDRFEREGWLLVRHYHEEVGASVGEAFGTEDRAAVEHYCRGNAIEFEWEPGGGLRTRQRRPAVIRHPVTGKRCWFNQIAFLNEWTIEPEIREYLVDLYGAGGLPFTTRFGNGDPVGEDVVRLLNQVYDEHTLREPWQAGDLLLVDNIRTAHGREAFEGEREVVVGLADPVRRAGGGPR